MLREQVKNELELLGLGECKHAVFYNCFYGIRFEIGTGEIFNEEKIVKNKYVESALTRAMTIFNSVIKSPSLLLWEIYPQDKIDRLKSAILFSKKISPILPMEEHICIDDDINKTQLYWDLKIQKIPIDKLLHEVIIGDLGGSQEFVSSVYIFDIENHVMLHMYDDRGLDVAAHDKNTLIPAYTNLNTWILDYDRDKIDKVFLS